MFARPVVVVVGAGASYEYRMPLGSQLASDIAAAVRFRFDHFSTTPTSGDKVLFDLLFRRFHTNPVVLNQYTQAGNAVAAAISSAISVDDALFTLSENQAAVEIGKMAIIHTIVRAERASSLSLSRETGRLDDSAGKDGWVEQLFSMATSNLKISQFDKAFEKITFVNFNYDRCIEHYLFWCLQRIGIPEADADSIVSSLKMIRPYGGVGPISRDAKGKLEYGYGGHLDPLEIIGRIRTYTESEILHDPTALQAIMHEASLIMFLGFGFHPQNLDLLRLDKPSDDRFVMATVKGIHQANLPDMTGALARTLRMQHSNIDLHDMTTPKLLSDLRPKIMMRVGR